MSTIDVYNDPYSRKRTAGIKRSQFEKLKRTKEFKTWKKEQLKYQFSKCAYCQVRLKKEGIIIHVDHVDPLYYGGSNDYKNLVLTCSTCNIKKWINDRYVRPEWLKQAKVDSRNLDRLHKARREQRFLMKDLVKRELDEEMLDNELSWLMGA